MPPRIGRSPSFPRLFNRAPFIPSIHRSVETVKVKSVKRGETCAQEIYCSKWLENFDIYRRTWLCSFDRALFTVYLRIGRSIFLSLLLPINFLFFLSLLLFFKYKRFLETFFRWKFVHDFLSIRIVVKIWFIFESVSTFFWFVTNMALQCLFLYLISIFNFFSVYENFSTLCPRFQIFLIIWI